MGRELNFDGGETSVLKALNSSGEVSGETLMEKLPGMVSFEIIDVIRGLISTGYVESDSNRGLHTEDDLKGTYFRINSGYRKDIDEALDPTPSKPKSRRLRRE